MQRGEGDSLIKKHTQAEEFENNMNFVLFSNSSAET